MISHGATKILQERLFLQSDYFVADVCDTCGLIVHKNAKTEKSMCISCKRKSSGISQVPLPYACKLLFQQLMAMGIAPRIITKHDEKGKPKIAVIAKDQMIDIIFEDSDEEEESDEEPEEELPKVQGKMKKMRKRWRGICYV